MTSGVDGRGRSVACFLFPAGRPRGFGPAQPSGRVRKSVRLNRRDAPDFVTRLARLARGTEVTWPRRPALAATRTKKA